VTVSFENKSNAIRALSMDAVEKANSGHPGMPMGIADVATVLFTEFLRVNPKHPEWPNRDRFILSAGHGSMLLYATSYLLGYPEMTLDQIKNFRQLGAITAGHPEVHRSIGIETTTGPLGQGIANAVGFALGEAILQSQFGKDIIDHYTYVIAGDGCLMEGISQEAISLAGHLNLKKLIVLFDDNGISIDGKTSLSTSENHLKRFEAANWNTLAIDGHNPAEIRAALKTAQHSDKPTLIACKTTIGFGAPTKANTAGAHGSPLGATEIAGARAALNWQHAPFEIPEDILHAWRTAGTQHDATYTQWQQRFNALPQNQQAELSRRLAGELPASFASTLDTLKKEWTDAKPNIASRLASGNVLDALTPHIPELLGGSADLSGSNNTKAKGVTIVSKDNYNGNYIHYGIREHGMAAAMNGLALYGGFIPFGGTFLVFSDYCKPAIRLSALMEQRVIYVMTHDSIGVGEDGPTHQPIEHIAALRATPNVQVFRPADSIETLECWALALSSVNTPSVLALTRQNLPTLRTEYTSENRSARGGYRLVEPTGKEQVTLIATGSEVMLAVETQKLLATQGIAASVVSLPSWELFDKQPAAYKTSVLPKDTLKVAIEMLSGFGWERYTGTDGLIVSMQGFGASAPLKDLLPHFGFTAEKIASKVSQALTKNA
jgi:transketolase